MTLKPGDAWRQAFGGSSVSYQQQTSTTDSLVGCLFVILIAFGGFYFYLDRFVADHSGEKVAQAQELVQPIHPGGDIPLQVKDLDKANALLQEVPKKSKHYASAQSLLVSVEQNRTKLKMMEVEQKIEQAESGSLSIEEIRAELSQVRNELNAVPGDKASQAVPTKLKTLERSLIKALAQEENAAIEREKVATVMTRVAYPDAFEKKMLEAGMDVYVSTSGPEHTTLHIQYVLMSRPLVYKMVNDKEIRAYWRALGFRKAIFTDGHSDTYTVDI
jgi:hypothetical protein